jgi:hypothetical protein
VIAEKGQESVRDKNGSSETMNDLDWGSRGDICVLEQLSPPILTQYVLHSEYFLYNF